MKTKATLASSAVLQPAPFDYKSFLKEINQGVNYYRIRSPSNYQERICWEMITDYHIGAGALPFPYTYVRSSYNTLRREGGYSFDPEESEKVERDCILMAKGFVSGIQWLGSPVGIHFLKGLVQAIGYKMVPMTLEEMLLSSDETIRQNGIRLEGYQKAMNEDKFPEKITNPLI